MTKRVLLLAGALLLAAITIASANVTMNALYSSHMVLQRDKPMPVFGTAAVGENVSVTFNSQVRSTTADSLGNWMVTLPAMSASTTGKTMTVTGNNTINITDVVVGDVWICSGQSNMAFSLSGCNRQTQDVATANFPGIRHIWVPLLCAPDPQRNFSGSWTVCSPSTGGWFLGGCVLLWKKDLSGSELDYSHRSDRIDRGRNLH